ncbi:hypothetical protein FHS83_001964 [Rhizomicrobium palustre]|uniref:Uncharacterized protein n=1 Tax=Rhizomicrobium palustre TaxID=189966 RepID=A0A846MYX6_9PROT|nr:hypothetical protein [Rhizomicrobium palustre]NIK88646.1 hypothetical protein [Rhizomicrobium palustre]
MGKWIVAALVFLVFVAPVPILLLVPQADLSGLATGLFAPKEESGFARAAFENLRQRKFAPVAAAFDPAVTAAKVPGALERVAQLFPQEEPKRLNLVSSTWEARSNDGIKTYVFLYEYTFREKSLLAQIKLYRKDGKLSVYGLYVQPEAVPLSQRNALTLAGKSPAHFIFTGVALALYLFWLISVYACLFTPIAKRKWLWVIFVLISFGSISMNWTTGALSWTVFSMGVSAMRFFTSGFMPWMVQISLPLGAILFWLKRSDLVARHEPDMRHDAVAPAP